VVNFNDRVYFIDAQYGEVGDAEKFNGQLSGFTALGFIRTGELKFWVPSGFLKE
jgi:hypothetical protein